MSSSKPTIMAVDGNSLLHRSYHALESSNLHDSYGRPTWAIKGMLNQLVAAAQRVRPDAVVIGFDTPGSSIRRERYTEYKATRSEKKPALVSQLELAQNMFTWAGFLVKAPAGYEADDVTATAAKQAGENGWECVIVTSDRDSFAHISDHTQVLRIITGGVENSPLLNPAKLETLTGIKAGQYLDYAAVRGDASDNLPGIRGIGEKTAAKLLCEFANMQEVWADVEAGGEKVIKVAGKACLTKLSADGAKEAWERNIDIMSAVMTIDLGIDWSANKGQGMLPLDSTKLAEACHVLNMSATAPSVVSAFGDTSLVPAPSPVEDFGLQEPPMDEEPEHYWEPPATQQGLHKAAEMQFF